jgi:hypothetical protein
MYRVAQKSLDPRYLRIVSSVRLLLPHPLSLSLSLSLYIYIYIYLYIYTHVSVYRWHIIIQTLYKKGKVFSRSEKRP